MLRLEIVSQQPDGEKLPPGTCALVLNNGKDGDEYEGYYVIIDFALYGDSFVDAAHHVEFAGMRLLRIVKDAYSIDQREPSAVSR